MLDPQLVKPRIFMVKPCFSPWFPHVFQWKIAFSRRCHRLLPEEAGKPWRAHLRSLAHRGTGWDGREFSQGVKMAIKVGKFGTLDVGNDLWYMMIFSVFIWYPIHSNSNRTSSDFFHRAFMGSFRGPHGRSWKFAAPAIVSTETELDFGMILSATPSLGRNSGFSTSFCYFPDSHLPGEGL